MVQYMSTIPVQGSCGRVHSRLACSPMAGYACHSCSFLSSASLLTVTLLFQMYSYFQGHFPPLSHFTAYFQPAFNRTSPLILRPLSSSLLSLLEHQLLRTASLCLVPFPGSIIGPLSGPQYTDNFNCSL